MPHPLLMQTDPASRLDTLVRLVTAYWQVLPPAALGMLAVYLLLPRVPRYPMLWGDLCGAAALISAGLLLIRYAFVPAEAVLFYAFAAIAVTSGTMMVVQRNPVHAALSFAMVVLSTCGLFLLQAAPFLMAGTAIVYAGAIVVTFLFVIMLAQQSGLSSADQRSREPGLAVIGGFVILAVLLLVLSKTFDASGVDADAVAELERLTGRAGEAARAGSKDEAEKKLGNVDKYSEEFQALLSNKRWPLRAWEQLPKVVAAVDQVQEGFSLPTVGWDEQKKRLARLHHVGLRPAVAAYGGLQPSPDAELSPFSRPPGRGPGGRPVLPAQNVAGLGRALFSDYLLAVQLAGTLLLVATVGAILIAGRRSEGLR